MATRSTIKIEGVNFAKVYKHYDGYPDGMIEWLTDFNTKFTEERGDDPEYKFAQLLRFSKEFEKKYNLDPSNDTGWGVMKFHQAVDVQFEYLLHGNGEVSYHENIY